MKWKDLRRSTNVEDRRGMPVGRGGVIGGGIGAVVITLVALFFGVDPSAVLQTDPAGGAPPVSSAPAPPPPANDQQAQFVEAVLGSTEDTWNRVFQQQMGREYRTPTLVLFSDATQSACGFAQAATGPFYCPRDQKLYIDLSFYQELQQRLGAPGDFAEAYVIAHEVGHHVQNLLGISERVQAAEQRSSRADANALSVRLELQADCFAGVWAKRTQQERQVLEPGDVQEALNAAAAVGDDRLQRQGQGYVVPESFTHGTSAQRARWFGRGFEAGDVNQCDTFGATQL